MNTPVFDFIDNYRKSNPVRVHMPGHKGIHTGLGIEDFDITEITGADELYEASGIIAESEHNAGELFGAYTFYSTEGSSLSIRAMLFLLVKWCKRQGCKAHVLAARNVHKTYINTAALLDIETDWIFGRKEDSYEVCRFTPKELEERLLAMDKMPAAVYITSPDYLGNIADIKGISEVCHKYGILLLVDNAHGAYLRFLEPSQHPMDLGADMCADSAHKTLPVLTGGAYLHISKSTDCFFRDNAKYAMEMFGSTSPSYLIMASLDLANPYMEGLQGLLKEFIPKVDGIKAELRQMGYTLMGSEPLKIAICCHGKYIAKKLTEAGIFPEYYDDSHLVLMVTPQNSTDDFERIMAVLLAVDEQHKAPREGIKASSEPVKAMSPHDAMLTDSEMLPAAQCVGRILAAATVSCPPAVPVCMMGERIDRIMHSDKDLRVVKEKEII